MGSPLLSAEATRNVPSPATLLQLLSPITEELARVEESLARQVAGFDERIVDYVEYVLGNTGKRLRPSLALLAGGATGSITEGHETLGVIVEMIHVATLVHDDVLDEASLRHGLPTGNSRWGNEISVLLGDCLFAHALKLAAGYPTTDVCRLVSDATNTVCAGEILQTQHRYDLDLSLNRYLDQINMKTGALFAVSCELGGILNAAPAPVVKSLKAFGENLGVAYQIFDDCVDLFGQERKAGKSLGTDVKKGKLTLPYLLLLQPADAARRQELGAMIFRDEPADRETLRTLVAGNGVVAKSLVAIETYVSRAERSLAVLTPNQHTVTLSALLHYLSTQSRQLLTAG